MRSFARLTVATMCLLLTSPWNLAVAAAGDAVLPQGSRIYMVTDKEVTSKRGEFDVGTVVPCRVWRDVEHDGVVFIKGGTVGACQVDKVKRRNMGGSEGKVSIAGMETKAVDGQQVMLTGGYNKEGSGRKAVVWTVGLLLLWPILFVPGGQAELPPGTVFDVSTASDLKFRTEAASAPMPRRLDLSGLVGGLSAEAMLDEMLQQKKPEVLRIRLSKDSPLPAAFVIDSVNGKTIEPLAMKVTDPKDAGGTSEAIAEVKLKPLAAHFQKGINRFEVAYQDGGARKATEVILDVQM